MVRKHQGTGERKGISLARTPELQKSSSRKELRWAFGKVCLLPLLLPLLSIPPSSRVWISKSLLHPSFSNEFLLNTLPLLPSSSHVNLHLNFGETIKLCTEMLLNLIAAHTGKSQISAVFGGSTAHRKKKTFSFSSSTLTNLWVLYKNFLFFLC